MAKKKQAQQSPVDFDPRHDAGRFSLDFLKSEDRFSAIYEYELLTAEEKAEYFNDIVQNGGRENSEKIAKDCRKRAETLRKKAEKLGSELQDTALPFIEQAQRLENLAWHHEHPDDPEVIAAQRDPLMGLASPEARDYPSNDPVRPDGAPTLDDGRDDSTEENPKKHVEKLNFWKYIHEWDQFTAAEFYFSPTKSADWKEAIFIRAQKDPFALRLLAANADYAIGRLLELARMGNQAAAKVAVEQIEKLVGTLNLYAKTDHQIFSQTAGTMASWPVLASPHPKLNESAKSIMGTLGVGQAYPFVIDGLSEWNPRRHACKIAIHLYEYLKKIRQHPEYHRDLYSGTGRPGMPPIHEAAASLSDIQQPGAVGEWWSVGHRVLLFSYPDPKSEPSLRNLTGLKKASKVNSKIWEILENAFKSLFHSDFH